MNSSYPQRPRRVDVDNTHGAATMTSMIEPHLRSGGRGPQVHPVRPVDKAAASSNVRDVRGLTGRRTFVAIALALLGPAVGLAAFFAMPKVYKANAFVMVVAQTGTGEGATVSFAQAYSRIATDPAVISSGSGAASVADAFATSRDVATSVSPDAPLIEVSAKSGAADRAAADANTVATNIVDYASRMRASTGVSAVLVGKAAAPLKPAGPRLVADVGLGVLGGVLLGAVTVLAWPGTRLAEERGDAVRSDGAR
jgi:uncharacterized protein involved in exopolysaccharide biosynthesis